MVKQSDAQTASDLLNVVALRQERMKVALEAILAECRRHGMAAWRTRIGDLAELGLKRPQPHG